jgi:hypothetical protein
MFKTTVRKPVIEVKALVVSVRVIVVHVLRAAYFPVGAISGLACDVRSGGGAGTRP